MSDKNITYAVDGDGIATITWDMPGRSMNVLSEASIRDYAGAARTAIADDNVRGVIVTSGKRDFIAGADLDMLFNWKGSQAIVDGMTAFNGVFREIETSGKPFAAAIRGMCLGGGFEIALACHYRIAAEDPRSQIGLPEALVGLMPGGGGTQRLPRLIGLQPALPLLLEGRKLGVGPALTSGLIHAIAPEAQLLAEAKRWLLEVGDPVQPWDKKGFKVPGGAVQSPAGYQVLVAGNAMVRQKTYGNYPNAQAILSSVYEGLSSGFDAGVRIEMRNFVKVVQSPQAKAMIRTLFFSMQEANKLSRRPKEAPKTEFKKIGMLGAGLMGHGIAHAAAAAGVDVILIDVSQEAADQGKAAVAKILDGAIKRKRMTEDVRDQILARITPTTDYGRLADADMVIEAVLEDREVKADVTAKTEAVINETAVFASNTSTLPITGLAKASARPGNFIGLHFFSPVHRMSLVEIIRGEETSDTALAAAMDFVKRIGKTPIVVNDARGFFTSRVFATYVQEGLAMLAEGINPALIENAGRIAGMPMGPLEVADAVNIDLIHHIGEQTRADMGDAHVPRPGDPVVDLFVNKLGRPGKKAGKGFYDYTKGGKRLWPELEAHFPLAAEQPDVEAVKRRLMYIQGVETARCVEENVVTDPRDADIGSILGWGFAPFTGGVLSYVDMVGPQAFVDECDDLAEQVGERFAPPNLLRDMAKKGEAFYAA
ncbi:MAG: 3-hydroxyacyl-CoA dehydrogenase NAD-binding domain-containing protein [Alphaproteobacteria bacterium]|nr:3-hydroxyacyl-CoA dehydrogenase NAD-binding domain-containing protein [Alphaproteobacteria bacterium]